jgi:hypothetical protein
MTAIETAIRDAVEKGGWENDPKFTLKRISETGKAYFKVEGFFPLHSRSLSEVFLDPSFWQALGKAREWIAPPKGQAYFYQHRFIDHLADGKDAESFFDSLS